MINQLIKKSTSPRKLAGGEFLSAHHNPSQKNASIFFFFLVSFPYSSILVFYPEDKQTLAFLKEIIFTQTHWTSVLI